MDIDRVRCGLDSWLWQISLHYVEVISDISIHALTFNRILCDHCRVNTVFGLNIVVLYNK